MRSTPALCCPLLLLLTCPIGQARGEEPAAPRPAWQEDPELKLRYQALEQAQAVEPPLKQRKLELAPPAEVEERIELIEDGGVLVSRPLAAADEAELARLGVRRAASKEQLGHNTLFGGRYYRLLLLVAEGPSEARLLPHLGETLRLLVALRSDRQAVLLDVRRP